MDEAAFNALAERELDRIENAFEALLESGEVDIDVELQPGGVLELEFDDGSRMVINRHSAAREIWVAAKSGGFHFRPDAHGQWTDTRSGEELWAALRRLAGAQAGTSLAALIAP